MIHIAEILVTAKARPPIQRRSRSAVRPPIMRKPMKKRATKVNWNGMAKCIDAIAKLLLALHLLNLL